MITKPLYRFKREDGGITISPNKPECEYTELIRLIADEGMVLTNGIVTTRCVDTENMVEWYEIYAPENIKSKNLF